MLNIEVIYPFSLFNLQLYQQIY